MKRLCSLVVISVLLGSCASMNSMGTADTCVFQTDKTAKVFVECEGEQVGFCCNRSKGKLGKMAPPAKKTAIAKSSK